MVIFPASFKMRLLILRKKKSLERLKHLLAIWLCAYIIILTEINFPYLKIENKNKNELGQVVCAFNPRAREAEEGWYFLEVQGQPDL